MENRPIYHYTDVHGLFGIVQAKKVWLTSGHHLNDKAEGSWVDLRKPRSGDWLRPQLRPVEDMRFVKVSEHLRATWELLDSATSNRRRDDVFVASFSTNDDQLSQWRAYSADGTGVSVGFSQTSLSDSWMGGPHIVRGLVLHDVTYGDRVEELQAIMDNQDAHPVEEALYQRTLSNFVWTTKNPAFEEEAEVRILYWPDPNAAEPPWCVSETKYRVARGVDLVPYYELRVLPEAIESITLGPKCAINEQTLIEFLVDNDLGGVEVRASTATYR